MGNYSRHVFINCPFDQEYQPLLEALTFTLCYCGFKPRCALEVRLRDQDQTRLAKIFRIIADCQFGIHDLSRTALDADTKLPRFNMPLELGMFLGMKQCGPPKQRKKIWLGLDSTKYSYQKFISDLAGIDISAHENDAAKLIGIVRDWLNDFGPTPLPASKRIRTRYAEFLQYIPNLYAELQQHPEEVTFRDQVFTTETYLAELKKNNLF